MVEQEIRQNCQRYTSFCPFIPLHPSRYVEKIEDSLNSEHSDKSSGRSKHAVSELGYLVTFNRSITQAVACTMQDLLEVIFTHMANLTLARRDNYLDYIRAGLKHDTLTVLRNTPLHMCSLFPDQLLKAEGEISCNKEKSLTGTSKKKPIAITPMLRLLQSHFPNLTRSLVFLPGNR